MNKIYLITLLFLLFLADTLLAFQAVDIPLTPEAWEFKPQTVEFLEYKSKSAMRLLPESDEAILKDFDFTNGTIEFDIEFVGSGFAGISFRRSDNGKEAENFYLRAFEPFNPLKRTTLQYATIVDGMSLWDLTDDYQAGATLYKEGWNHIKLVVSGRQMKIYVNDLQAPAMHVPILEGIIESGGISLQGNAIYANLVIYPDQVEDLSPMAGYDPTINDSRYLRNWQISHPINFPFGKDLTLDLPSMFGGEVVSDLPDSTTKWMPIEAENRGLINISRLHGLPEGGERRLIWLKTTIKSEIEQQRRLDLGFSDEVWVFINGQILHVDKNYFGTPGMKEPLGRCTIENTSITLPLSKGENEIMIGIANYFYGWGIIARLDNMQGLQLP